MRRIVLALLSLIAIIGSSIAPYDIQAQEAKGMAVEITDKRTENSKTYSLGGNKYSLDSSIGIIHYKDNYSSTSEQWKDINLTPVAGKTKTEMVVKTAPYELTIDGLNVTVKDKKTGSITTIKLTDIGTSLTEATTVATPVLTFDKGLATAKDIATDTDLEISWENSRVKYSRILKSDKASTIAKFNITQTGTGIALVSRATDSKAEGDKSVTVISDIKDGVLTESIDTTKVNLTYPVKIDPVLDVDIASDTDDVYRVTDYIFYYNQWAQSLGNPTGGEPSYYMSGFRFLGINIAKGSSISTADISVYSATDNSLTPVYLNVYGEAADNATTYSDSANFEARSVTTAYSAWDLVGTSWTTDTKYTSPNINNVITEIMSRAGWASGNSIVIRIHDDASASGKYRLIYDYNHAGASLSAKLHIEYTVDWGLTDWLYRKPIVIAHTADGAQTNYQMRLLVGETSAYGNTGGTITTSGDYTYHRFLLADTGAKFVACKDGTAEILVVAGGGGGGSGQSGGGGAGGIAYNATYSIGNGNYTVTVGDGGAGGGAGNTDGVNGNNSSIATLTATGGGSGAGYNAGGNQPGNNGGCGGGAAETGTASVGGTGSQGYNGGADSAGTASPYTGGGGGGMGAVGSTSRPSGGTSGGGNGLSTYSALLIAADAGVDISGTHWVAGGGGGGGNTTQTDNPGAGGNGGGGAGSCTGVGTAGTAGSGGGGGGGAYNAKAGGKGGSGVVVIKCLTSAFSTDVDCEGHAAADFDDLRFTTSNGTTLCDYWIESVIGSTPDRIATVWIEVPSIAAHPDDTTIYMYYGGTETAVSSGAATFIVFDDFERGNDGDTVGGSWTEDVAHVHISTEQDMGNTTGYFGTRAMKLVGYTSTQPKASIPVTSSANIAINYRYYKEDLQGNVMQHGDGAGANDMSIWFSTTEDVQVYDGAGWVDTTLNCVKDAWGYIDIHKFIWASTVDVTVDGATATGRDITYSSAGDDNVVRFYGDTITGRDIWIDNFFVHNYTANAPTWSSFGAEVTLSYDIANTPDTKAFGVIAASTTYYAKGTAPSNPVSNSDCTYTVTNNGTAPIDVSVKGNNFTGGVGWALGANVGENIVKITVYKTGDNPASGVVLTTSGQSFISNLADGGHVHWDFRFDTGTFTDGVAKSTTIRLTSTVH